jgi:hypothetical protein
MVQCCLELKIIEAISTWGQNTEIFTYGTFKNTDVKEIMDDNKQIKNNALL